MSGARLCEIKPTASNWLLPTVQNQARAGGIPALWPRAGRPEINRRLLRRHGALARRDGQAVPRSGPRLQRPPQRWLDSLHRIVDRSPRAAGRANDDLDNRNRLLWHALPV